MSMNYITAHLMVGKFMTVSQMKWRVLFAKKAVARFFDSSNRRRRKQQETQTRIHETHMLETPSMNHNILLQPISILILFLLLLLQQQHLRYIMIMTVGGNFHIPLYPSDIIF